MGTNYYLRRVRPREVHDEYHVCKTSFGWPTWFQSDDWYHPDREGNPLLAPMGYAPGQLRWPDEENGEVVPEWQSVADIRALIESGEWQLSDEYGALFEDSLEVLDMLCARGVAREDVPCDYHDADGFRFSRGDFR